MSSLKIVVPDGSMEDVVKGLFEKAGLPITVRNRRTKQGSVNVPWINQVAFQRPQEIPPYLERGHFDLAIVGEDWLKNWECNAPVLLKLAIGRAGNKAVRIILAAKESSGIRSVADLPEKCEVATEYVALTNKFFENHRRPDIRVTQSYGNTELKIQFGATAIVDVTESGQLLVENGLVVIAEIMTSHTVLVANQSALTDPEKLPAIKCFTRLVKGAAQAAAHVLLIANVASDSVAEAGKIMGGLKGPTRAPLLVEGWFALQSIIPREKEQEIIFKLHGMGVEDIIVIRDIPLIMS